MDKSVLDERIGRQSDLARPSSGLFEAIGATIALQLARFMGFAAAAMLDTSCSELPYLSI
jgi:hypothetical protein